MKTKKVDKKKTLAYAVAFYFTDEVRGIGRIGREGR